MSKKQSDYLANLLSDEEPSTPVEATPASLPSPTPDRAISRAGLSLLGRENALARAASGEVRQVTQLLLDPARVRIWKGNARIQAQLTEENCRELIDSIIAEGGQKVPAVVRHVTGDPNHDYELIAGTRRHFAISWLRANSYPDMRLLAQVADLDDESAFRLADIENRARKDISDIERARNYALALNTHYSGKAVRMAERLRVSKGWLSKMLKAASIPDGVLAAFADWRELPLNPAYKLACTMDDKSRASAIQSEAKAIATEQARAAKSGAAPMPGNAVLSRLLAATAAPSLAPAALKMEVTGARGRPVLSVKGVSRQGITLHLPMASGASDEELTAALREVLAALRQNGVSVQ